MYNLCSSSLSRFPALFTMSWIIQKKRLSKTTSLTYKNKEHICCSAKLEGAKLSGREAEQGQHARFVSHGFRFWLRSKVWRVHGCLMKISSVTSSRHLRSPRRSCLHENSVPRTPWTLATFKCRILHFWEPNHPFLKCHRMSHFPKNFLTPPSLPIQNVARH